jgi:hypothetical protein
VPQSVWLIRASQRWPNSALICVVQSSCHDLRLAGPKRRLNCSKVLNFSFYDPLLAYLTRRLDGLSLVLEIDVPCW